MHERSVEESRLRQLLGKDDADRVGDLSGLAELLTAVAAPPGGRPGARGPVAGEEAALAAFRAARAADAAAAARRGRWRCRGRRTTTLGAVTAVMLGGLAVGEGGGSAAGGGEPDRRPACAPSAPAPPPAPTAAGTVHRLPNPLFTPGN